MSGPPPLPLISPPDWLGAFDRGAGGYQGNLGASPALATMMSAANGVNPMGGTVNCGNIIDAVVARLSGADPDAVAPTAGDGSFDEIDQRFNTTVNWGQSFQAAYDAVQNGGPGTMAIVGIEYSGGGSHVVVLANVDGTVGIIEGQDWGDDDPREVVSTVDRANERYNSDGGSDIGFGIIGAGAPAPPGP
jgi:hypothetical protein